MKGRSASTAAHAESTSIGSTARAAFPVQSPGLTSADTMSATAPKTIRYTDVSDSSAYHSASCSACLSRGVTSNRSNASSASGKNSMCSSCICASCVRVIALKAISDPLRTPAVQLPVHR